MLISLQYKDILCSSKPLYNNVFFKSQNHFLPLQQYFMEDKQTDNDEHSKNGDISDAEDCGLSLQKYLTVLEEKSGKMSGINVEESLTADDDLMFLQELDIDRRRYFV
ncbi:hypothetical protein AVEN_78280-1 [Araneus ventricosus]|uniref:Uncharacterized protein n=1 Tax=Araneus ventricosus TaxID=182803 RepID=A0A4Y2U720_ARAVE|nr:hypothetical protein AVEN_78280-1 [Araneus ventricosus]